MLYEVITRAPEVAARKLLGGTVGAVVTGAASGLVVFLVSACAPVDEDCDATKVAAVAGATVGVGIGTAWVANQLDQRPRWLRNNFV